LQDVAVIVDLHELAPVGGRAAGGRHWRRFCFTQAMPSWPLPACEPPVRREPTPAGGRRMDGPWVGNERDQPDVAAARWTRERKLLAHPGQEFRPGNPRGVVRGTGSGCAAVGACPCFPLFPRLFLQPGAAGDRHLFLRNTSQSPPDRQRRDGPPELVVRRKHSVIAMPVLPRQPAQRHRRSSRCGGARDG
jgi:hypothetical protein